MRVDNTAWHRRFFGARVSSADVGIAANALNQMGDCCDPYESDPLLKWQTGALRCQGCRAWSRPLRLSWAMRIVSSRAVSITGIQMVKPGDHYNPCEGLIDSRGETLGFDGYIVLTFSLRPSYASLSPWAFAPEFVGLARVCCPDLAGTILPCLPIWQLHLRLPLSLYPTAALPRCR